MLQKLKGLPWSAFCNLGFIVLGAFQLFPGKFPSLAINQPLGGGLFVAVFAVLAIGSVIAAIHDSSYLQSRLEGIISRLDRMEERDKERREHEITTGKPPDSPEIRALDLRIAATHEARLRIGEIFYLTGARPAHLTVTPAAVEQQLRNAAGTEELPTPEKPDA